MSSYLKNWFIFSIIVAKSQEKLKMWTVRDVAGNLMIVSDVSGNLVIVSDVAGNFMIVILKNIIDFMGFCVLEESEKFQQNRMLRFKKILASWQRDRIEKLIFGQEAKKLAVFRGVP